MRLLSVQNSYQGKLSSKRPKCTSVACQMAKIWYMKSGRPNRLWRPITLCCSKITGAILVCTIGKINAQRTISVVPCGIQVMDNHVHMSRSII